MFFFSSRRRHTRYGRDWSSDVCSSDLAAAIAAGPGQVLADLGCGGGGPGLWVAREAGAALVRSEERRVGEGWRSWWSPYDSKKHTPTGDSVTATRPP